MDIDTPLSKLIGSKIGMWEITCLESKEQAFSMTLKHSDTGEKKTVSAPQDVWKREGIRSMVGASLPQIDILSRITIIKASSYRTTPKLNQVDDTIRVTLDMPIWVWKSLRKLIEGS